MKDDMMDRRVANWHLNKGFAISMVGAILINAASGIWYAAALNVTIQQDHESIVEMTAWREKQDDEKSKIDSHLAVVDEKLSAQSKSLDHIIDLLEKRSTGGRSMQ